MGKFPGFKREFKFTSELGENEVYMLLGLPLGPQDDNMPFIIGSFFAEEMYFWKSTGRNIGVKINCPGGMVFDGFPIMDAILECGAKTEIIGICASMAVPIAVSGKKRTAYNYAKMMIHPVSGGSKPNEKMAMDMMSQAIKQVLLNRSNLKESQVDEMLKPGAKDTWLSAEKMLEHGLIDEIIDTELTLQGEESDPYAVYKVYNQLIHKDMAKEEKVIEGDALKAITDIHNKLNESNTAIQAKDAEITKLQNDIKAFKDAQKLEKENAAKARVEVAIKNKQITISAEKPELKDQFVQMALNTPDAFEAMLAAKPAPRTSVINHMKSTEVGAEGEETYEYLANYNPQKLYAMMDEEPEKYKKLVNQYHEKVRK